MIANFPFYQRIVVSSKSAYQYFYCWYRCLFLDGFQYFVLQLGLASILQIFPTTSWEKNHCDFFVLSACILWRDPLEDFLIGILIMSKQIFRQFKTGSHRVLLPKLAKLANQIVQNCKAKYDRHPKKQDISESPIPSHVGEMPHIDIFSTDKKYYHTCIEEFSPLYSVCRQEQLRI